MLNIPLEHGNSIFTNGTEIIKTILHDMENVCEMKAGAMTENLHDILVT